MSFFGFDQPNSLEDEKRKFLERGLQDPGQEDLAVYTWGEESYDGLGDALQERGDEMNDETFGGTGEVGKDFDFGNHALPTEDLPERVQPHEQLQSQLQSQPRQSERPRQPEQPRAQEQAARRADLGTIPATTSSRTAHSLEAIWDDRSPFSVLPKSNGGAHPIDHVHAPAPATTFAPFDAEDPVSLHQQQPITLGIGGNQAPRTLEEIEAEMREAFAAQRIASASPSLPQTLSQAQLRNTNAHRQQGWQHGQTATPPPRMYMQQHAQSPRFQQQQQQQQLNDQLLQQQQLQQLQQLQLQQLQMQERQQQRQLELQEQLRLEEIERQRQHQLHLRQQAQLNAQYLHHQRQASGGTPLDNMRYAPQRHRSATPSRLAQQQQQPDAPFQQSLQYLPRDIQMQQRLLAEMAQAEFLHSLQGSPVKELGEDREVQEMLRAEAMRKIMEAERMEEKRRRKLEKIRHMSRYNDLMTQSDKDFITRIQVSQLVTQDPYADDFYAQVYGAIMRSRMGLNAPEALLRFGSGGGVGLGLAQIKGGTRRPNAMQRMEQQVERIVNNARLREKEKISLNSLQGALGKTAGRSYKAAPRQLLQVDSNANGGPGGSPTLSHASAHISKADASHPEISSEGEGAARAAAKMGKEALGVALDSNGVVRKDPLTHREALIILERLYDTIIDVEALKQSPPPQEEEEAYALWEADLEAVINKLWEGLRVLTPLETSEPHPFVSLITPIKGKRMLPRVTRYFDTQRLQTVLTLLVACFSQLDVIRDAQLLDHIDDTRERRDVEAQTQAFLGNVMQSVLTVAATGNLRLINGLLGLFLERNDVGVVARTRPGVALLTMLVSRVETIRQEMVSGMDPQEVPAQEELQQWQLVWDHLFQLLTPHLLFMFPSVRQAIASSIPLANVPDADQMDTPVWQFFATVALHASVEQQQVLVTSLRERVLESVATANKDWTADEEQRRLRLGNVNIFLHALGLDSSQISL